MFNCATHRPEDQTFPFYWVCGGSSRRGTSFSQMPSKILYSTGFVNSSAETEATITPHSLHFLSFLSLQTDLSIRFKQVKLRCDARKCTPCCPWFTLPGQLWYKTGSFQWEFAFVKVITNCVFTSNPKWDLFTSAAFFLFLKTGQMRIRGASTEERDPLLLWGRIHFVRRFGFKSVGTNLWHEVILCWSFSPKFIHQLFTVNADCISVGNYKGWVFSLRQKECDTAEPTPNVPELMSKRHPKGRIIYVLETVCSGEGKKADTLF